MFCLNVCLCTTYVPGARRTQKRALDTLELESQMVVSHSVVGLEPRSSKTAVSALSCGAISPGLRSNFYFF